VTVCTVSTFALLVDPFGRPLFRVAVTLASSCEAIASTKPVFALFFEPFGLPLLPVGTTDTSPRISLNTASMSWGAIFASKDFIMLSIWEAPVFIVFAILDNSFRFGGAKIVFRLGDSSAPF
jgi:hypothetical protein